MSVVETLDMNTRAWCLGFSVGISAAFSLFGTSCDLDRESTFGLESGQSPLYVAAARRFGSDVPVCWEALDPTTAVERGWVRSAVEETWQKVSAVRFSGWGACTAGARGVHIRERDVGPYTLGLGTDIDAVGDGMVLNFTFSTWSPGCKATRAYCIRVGAVHEFGHALGFAHEQNRADTPSWCTSEQGADGDVTIGAWDLDSVMNYCNPRWTGNGELSASDIEGVRASYGSGGGDWDVARSDGSSLLPPQRGGDASSRGADDVLLADVSGDGRADLVFVFAAKGDLWVAPASADAGRFDALSPWLRGSAPGATRHLAADVTGDGKADDVAFFSGTGTWSVATSTGRAFSSHAEWRSGHGAGSAMQLLADVTGDKRADAVAFFAATGNWWVAPSSGGAFTSYSLWKSSHGVGSSSQLLADVTGDSRADAVAFFSPTGSWWVAPSTGTAFGTYTLWRSGHGAGSSSQLLADVTGDGRADALAVFRKSGSFWVAPAVTGSFSTYSLWKSSLGTALSDGMTLPLHGDSDGDGREDIVVRWQR